MTIESLLKHPYDVLAVGAEDSGTALRRCDYGIFKQLAGSTKDDFFADKGEGAQVGADKEEAGGKHCRPAIRQGVPIGASFGNCRVGAFVSPGLNVSN